MDYTKQIDYSSLSTYISCPRKFLFQYVLHIRSMKPSIDLVFGSCWHYGLEVAYKALQANSRLGQKELTRLSEAGFNLLWSIEGEPHFDPDLVFPKSPVHAANMYHKYWEQFHLAHSQKTILGVEEPFAIAVTPDDSNLVEYVGRMDLILGEKNFIEIVDHKSAKSVSTITSPGYEISLQTDGYLTAGHIYYDSIPRITYLTALCQKSKIAFESYTYSKSRSSIERFLSDLCAWITTINHDLVLLEQDQSHATERSYNPVSFRRNPGYACTAYFRKCPYFDLCTLRNNPLLWQDSPPPGYEIREWDPADHDANLKAKIAEKEKA